MNILNLLANADVVGFYALSLVAIIASLRVVTHANPVHAILSLIVSLLAVAGIFFILGASFAGILEMIVYAGAILVLFVFVIMMLNLGHQDHDERTLLRADAWAMPLALGSIIFAVLLAFISAPDQLGGHSPVGHTMVSAKMVGQALYSGYVLLVVVAAFLLLGALVAAYHVGKRALDDENISHSQLHQGDNTWM